MLEPIYLDFFIRRLIKSMNGIYLFLIGAYLKKFKLDCTKIPLKDI